MGDRHPPVSPYVRVARFLRTVRYLRWEQVLWRIWYKIYKPRVKLPPDVGLPGTRLKPWVKPPLSEQTVYERNTVEFLHCKATLRGASDWNDQSRDKLWLYNLHYFEDLTARSSDMRTLWHQELIHRWIIENPPTAGAGWEPYPTSRRIVNWLKWIVEGNDAPAGVLESLALQTAWLRKRLEYHLLGNHLINNAKALVFAGVFFDGPTAREWAAKGFALVRRELEEQVLSDGGHFERSPMYHLIVLTDILDIINLCCAYGRNAPEYCYIAAGKMLRWACEMQHPDGSIPFFNDAAVNVSPTAAELETYAKQLGIEVSRISPAGESCFRQESGYVKLANQRCTVFFDVAPVGPDYLPAHGHADTLSIEVSVGSQKVFVNSGTSLYADSNERYQQRSTAAHNTIEIDGSNSSEIWGSFRVGRRAYPHAVQFSAKEGCASAYHDGYRFLRGSPIHHRALALQDNLLRIRDRIGGRGAHDVIGRFHLHPNVSVESLRSGDTNHRCILKRKNTGKSFAELAIDKHVSVSVEKTSYHPEFGLSIPNDSIVFCYRGHLPSDIETQLLFHD